LRAVAQPNKKSTLRFMRWLLLLPLPVFWLWASHAGWLQALENQSLGLLYRFRGEISSPVKIIYVDVDHLAIQEMGERPWDRALFGNAAATLIETGHAKAVGFDFVFSDLGVSRMVKREDLESRNFNFGKVTHAHPEIILGAQYSGGEGRVQEAPRVFPLQRLGYKDAMKNDLPELPQYPISGPTWGTVGLFDVDYGYGGDEMPRWVPLFADTPNTTFYHLSLQMALRELGLSSSAIHRTADRIDLMRPDGTTAISIPLREGQLLEINWFSSWDNPLFNRHVSLGEVLSYADDLTDEKAETKAEAQKFFTQFAGALILIGPVDALLQDLAPTPFDSSPVPKVGAHGNLIKTICSQLFLQRLSWQAEAGITLLLTALVTGLAIAGGARAMVAKIMAVLAAAIYVLLALQSFKAYHLVLPLVAPLGATFTTSFCALIWQVIEEQKQKGRIKGMFGAYVSPQLVHSMVEAGEDPQLGGHDDEITAYFSDIQSFSAFSEKLGSGPLVELMNEYLTACTDIVQAEGGTLDKYIGDAVVAMFGAPVPLKDHAYRACVATQLVHRKLGELRDKWKSEGDKWPEIVWNMQSRIGLNSGLATIGNMGSRTRFNYTMMGDNVNLAARMESGSKSWGAYTMCSEATRLSCLEHGGDRVVFRPLGRIVVMGRSKPVLIYEIMGLKESLPAGAHECIDLFERALARYYVRDWDGAIERFKQCVELEPNQPGKTPGVKTNPSLVYLGITEHYKAEPPPENWDGVYIMKEK
jgi:adenylate cyclase